MRTDSIKIVKMVNGGYGLARREDGQIVLLQGCLPGEEVTYAITEKKKKTLFGKTTAVLSNHHDRISPPCPFYGECGGCNLQHCGYEKQLDIKHAVVSELFHGITESVLPVIPSPLQFGYRQRVRLQVAGTSLGFHRFKSKDIIEIDQCLLAHTEINSTLTAASGNRHFNQLCHSTDEIDFLYNPGTNATALLFHLQRKPRPADRKAAIKLTETVSNIETIYFQGQSFSRQGPFSSSQVTLPYLLHQEIATEQLSPGITLHWEVGGFCQVNLQQNHNLLDHVLGNCSDIAQDRILDLFCGMGNFSIPLAKKAGWLVGIEGQGASIRCAQYNCKHEQLENTSFIKGPIEDVCKDFVRSKDVFDVTVLDPPRQGIPGLAPIISAITRKKLIYISCDPATLARDAKVLQQNNLSLRSLQPFDMFPQTHHIECIAVFEKN